MLCCFGDYDMINNNCHHFCDRVIAALQTLQHPDRTVFSYLSDASAEDSDGEGFLPGTVHGLPNSSSLTTSTLRPEMPRGFGIRFLASGADRGTDGVVREEMRAVWGSCDVPNLHEQTEVEVMLQNSARPGTVRSTLPQQSGGPPPLCPGSIRPANVTRPPSAAPMPLLRVPSVPWRYSVVTSAPVRTAPR